MSYPFSSFVTRFQEVAVIIKLINKELQLVGELEEKGGNTFAEGSVIQATNKALFIIDGITTDPGGAMTFIVEPFRLGQ